MAAAETITSPHVRWTRHTIDKAIRCPKPKGAIRRYDDSVRARGASIGRLLAHILAHADVIDDGRRLDPDGGMRDHCGAWLLVPLPADLLDYLLALGVEQADLEPDPDIEPDQEGEPSIGAPEAVSQASGWRTTDAYGVDCEDDQIDEQGTDADDEPNLAELVWAPDWQPHLFAVHAADD